MTDEESPTESQPTESEPTQAAPVESEATQSAPIADQPAEDLTEVIPPPRPWWRRPGVVGLVAGGVALITAIALVVVLVVLPDGSQQAEEQVFLTPLDDPGADPFTDASMATPLDPTMTTPGPDPAGVPPADPNATRTVYGDTDGLFGGTRNESTCDGQGLIDYLQKQPAKAAAWASVPKISVDQIPSYIQGLTPVRLRADTRVLDHGYVNGQAYSRQAVLQALTAVMVDKYGMPRVRCMSGSPLLDIPEVEQMSQQQAQPGQQAQPARKAVARKPVFIGTQWRGFNPRVIVVILRPLRNRIIDFIILLDLRRLPVILLFGRRIGIRLGIAGVDLRVFDVDLVVARPRAIVAPAPQAPAPAPLPIQAAPPVQAPPPVQGPPARAAGAGTAASTGATGCAAASTGTAACGGGAAASGAAAGDRRAPDRAAPVLHATGSRFVVPADQSAGDSRPDAPTSGSGPGESARHGWAPTARAHSGKSADHGWATTARARPTAGKSAGNAGSVRLDAWWTLVGLDSR